MILYIRRLTQLAGKMGPALRVACMDVGEGRKHGGGSFAYMDVGKGREHGGGSFAYMDVGKGREHGGGSFDWRSFRGNINNLISVDRPE